MKVIKRDGHYVDYDREKIKIAIEKANSEVPKKERASIEEIKEICHYIESQNKKRILVEDIQDIIEMKLMELERFELAKHYIVYRYTRMLVRKSNTTDESILSLIKNNNKELVGDNLNKKMMLASSQRDYIAGEVSRDLTKRMLLPELISDAHEKGILHFHDMDYFIQPIFNCCLINLKDMLDNGTVINGKYVESPKSFREACLITTQIISVILSNQYGGVSLEVKDLAKYLKLSYINLKDELLNKYEQKIDKKIINELVNERIKEELKIGIKLIQSQLNTLLEKKGQAPIVTLCLNLVEDDEYIEENALIIEEILLERLDGIKNEREIYITQTSPKLVYVLYENNNLTGGEYDYLTKLAIKCAEKRTYPDFISSKKMKENYKNNVFSPMGCRNFLTPWKDEDGNYKFEGRFNQGVVTINLPQIGIVADGDEEKFWELFNERLDLCYEALMCRHHSLMGITSEISPIHWQHGAIARLKKHEKIDKYLQNGYSTLSLGYIGLYELTKIMKNVSHTDQIGEEFAIKVMKHMKKKCEEWKKDTGLGFTLYGTPAESLCFRFARKDLEQYGKIKDLTDKGYYTNSFHIDNREPIDIYSKLDFESKFQNISSGGAITYIEIPNTNDNTEQLENIIKYIYENIQYAEFNAKNDNCEECGYIGPINLNENNELECPCCGNKDKNKITIKKITNSYFTENDL